MRDWQEIKPGKNCTYLLWSQISIVVGGEVQPAQQGRSCGAPAKWRIGKLEGPREWFPDFYAYRCEDHRPEFLTELEYFEKMMEAKMIVIPYIPLQTPVSPLADGTFEGSR